MRRIILFLAAVLMVVSIACGQSEPAASADTPARVAAPAGIPSAEARDHMGEQATVCGPVKRGSYRKVAEGRPTFLNFDHSLSATTPFIVVIWESDRGNFPKDPETHYENKQVCATGLIEPGQEGKPVIIAREASQLQIMR